MTRNLPALREQWDVKIEPVSCELSPGLQTFIEVMSYYNALRFYALLYFDQMIERDRLNTKQ